MFVKFMFLNVLLAPEDSGSGSGPVEEKSLDIGDMVKYFGEGLDEKDTEEKEEIDEEGDEKDKEGKDDKEDEKLDELKLDDEENQEDIVLNDVPSLNSITKKYPTILKDFPQLKPIFYREQQYSEVFPTVKDAREAVEKVRSYDNFENSLLSGDISAVLNSVKEADKEAFDSITDHFLNTLGKVDSEARLKIIGRVAKDIAVSMAQNGDENMKLAAQYMHKYLFNDANITGYKLNPPKSDAKDEKATLLDKREQEFVQSQLDTHVGDVSTRVENLLTKSIEEVIDSKNQMTPYVKSKAIKDIIASLDDELKADSRWTAALNQAWIDAGRNGFNRAKLDKIRNSCLHKAKGMLPAIMRRVKAEALKGNTAREDRDFESDNKPLPRGGMAKDKPANRNERSNNQSNRDSGNKIPRGMSTRDFFMKD